MLCGGISFRVMSSMRRPLLVKRLVRLVSVKRSFASSTRIRFLRGVRTNSRRELLLIVLTCESKGRSARWFIFNSRILNGRTLVYECVALTFLVVRFKPFYVIFRTFYICG